MTKKIILIIGILIIAGGVIWFVFYNNGKNEAEGEVGGLSFHNFFPFGKNDDPASTTTKEDGNLNNRTSPDDYNLKPTEIPKLRKISNEPVAGMVIFNVGTTSIIRFVDKATGNVYEAHSNSLNLRRLTNTTIPKVSRVYWLQNGSAFLAQTVNESDFIETSYVQLKEVKNNSAEPSVPYEVSISKLPTGIKELSINPDNKKIIYYTTRGVSDWFISNPDGTNSKLVYQSNITEWVLQWFSSSSVLLTTKNNGDSFGYSYILNVNNGKVSRVIGDLAGLSSLARQDSKKILLSTEKEIPILMSLNLSDRSLLPVGATLSEKCAWDPSDLNFVICGTPKSLKGKKLPESWYKGLVNTDDLIERINVEENFVFIISDPKESAGEELDVEKIMVSKDGKNTIFINKKDSSLWLAKIKE